MKELYPLVTLYGSNYIKNDWTKECMESWGNIENIKEKSVYILPDKLLNEEEKDCFDQLNFTALEREKEVEAFLKSYPALAFIREKDMTWRKLLDTAILFDNAKRITIIDTDVYIKDRISLPLSTYDIVYMREDIPAYRAHWKMPWKEKMVPALNAGIIIVNPKIIDFEYLEQFVENYIKNCKGYWWSEQSAWACLAGRCEKRAVFSGQQVRVTSAMRKRTPKEMIANEYKHFGNSKMIKDYAVFKPYLEGGSIFHFAGPGKYMFRDSLDFLQNNTTKNPIEIKAIPEKTLGLKDKVLISARLFGKENF